MKCGVRCQKGCIGSILSFVRLDSYSFRQESYLTEHDTISIVSSIVCCTVMERISAGDLKGAVEAVEELESGDTRMAVAKNITAALLSPKGSTRLMDAIRRGGGGISAAELADIAKTARDREEG